MQNNFDFGLTDYPIFNEDYRAILNDSILSHYRFFEIGFQNPSVFRDRLNTRMNRIMRDKYNALFEAKTIEFNPLYNIEITETFDRSVESNDANESESTNTYDENTGTSQYNADYPNDNLLDSETGVNELDSNVYIDNAQKLDTGTTGTGTGKNTNTGKSDAKESYVRTTKGSSAGLPFSKALLQLKDFYEKYDLHNQIINELSDLFMQIY